ncbi:stage III sporulation protein AC [Paenibacillus montaniterrae]|nr:stage III sporulation protein AC [Paenibacillus montaniterrae]
MTMEITAIFQIAGVGIIIAIMHTVLKQMGKEDIAHWITVLGFVIGIFMVIDVIAQLFQEIKSIFLFQ